MGAIVFILIACVIYGFVLFTKETVREKIDNALSVIFGIMLTTSLFINFGPKQTKDYIYINRYDLGVKTIVKDSIEDTIFITDKYMTKEEFIKQYIEK